MEYARQSFSRYHVVFGSHSRGFNSHGGLKWCLFSWHLAIIWSLTAKEGTRFWRRKLSCLQCRVLTASWLGGSPRRGPFSVEFVCSPCTCRDFLPSVLPESINTRIWLIDDCKLTFGVSVSVRGCFSVTLLQTSDMSRVLDLANYYKYVLGSVLSHQKLSTNSLVVAAACQWKIVDGCGENTTMCKSQYAV